MITFVVPYDPTITLIPSKSSPPRVYLPSLEHSIAKDPSPVATTSPTPVTSTSSCFGLHHPLAVGLSCLLQAGLGPLVASILSRAACRVRTQCKYTRGSPRQLLRISEGLLRLELGNSRMVMARWISCCVPTPRMPTEAGSTCTFHPWHPWR